MTTLEIETKKLNNKTIIILGSSRSHGDTRKFVNAVLEKTEADFIDLNDLNIGYFDYKYQNQEDDFLPIIKKVVGYENIILATPVYWYSMSAVMKTFVDRFTDLLVIHKDIGRLLRGKKLYTISSSSDAKIYENFLKTFELTANYLGMNYNGYIYGWIENGEIPERLNQNINSFIEKLK